MLKASGIEDRRLPLELPAKKAATLYAKRAGVFALVTVVGLLVLWAAIPIVVIPTSVFVLSGFAILILFATAMILLYPRTTHLRNIFNKTKSTNRDELIDYDQRRFKADSKSVEHRAFDFTPEEAEVLRLSAKGMSDRAIARELDMPSLAVRVHIYKMLDKTETQSLEELIIYARERNLI